MTGNVSLGVEEQMNKTSSALKYSSLEGKLSSRVDLIPGAFITCDPNGDVSGRYYSPKGKILSLSYSIKKPTRWVSVNFTMGGVDLSDISIVGIALKTEAPAAVATKVSLRSGTEDGFVDCFFNKAIVSYSQPSTHVDVLRIGDVGNKIPAKAKWRDIVFFFQTNDLELTVSDFKMFTV